MRPVLHGDVIAAARVLLGLPEPFRVPVLRRLFHQADLAERYWRAKGKLHPLYGDGSLMSASHMRRLVAEPSLQDDEYCTCIITVFAELLRWRLRAGHGSKRDLSAP